MDVHADAKLHRHRRCLYEIAIVHAAIGQVDEACKALRIALNDHSDIRMAAHRSEMDPLQQRSCYAETVKMLYE